RYDNIHYSSIKNGFNLNAYRLIHGGNDPTCRYRIIEACRSVIVTRTSHTDGTHARATGTRRGHRDVRLIGDRTRGGLITLDIRVRKSDGARGGVFIKRNRTKGIGRGSIMHGIERKRGGGGIGRIAIGGDGVLKRSTSVIVTRSSHSDGTHARATGAGRADGDVA